MGLFSFIGKAAKGIAHVVGGIAKTAVKVGTFGLRAGILPVPGGSFLSALLGQKASPMSTTGQKLGSIARLGVTGIRAQSTVRPAAHVPGPSVLRLSPVLPGGAVATARGPVARGTGAPPATFGGARTSKPGRRRSSSSSRRSSGKRTGRKRSSGRKLKFGSPAWRKKYLGKSKKRGRRKSR